MAYRRLGDAVELPTWVRYEHPLVELSLEHPVDWQAVSNAMGAALVVLAPIEEPVPFRANLVVSLHETATTSRRSWQRRKTTPPTSLPTSP